MYIPVPYFRNIPQLGDLTLEHIFIENGYPILFTCVNNDQRYLCLCCDTYVEQKWIISSITLDVLKQLVYNEISIYAAFKEYDGKACIATWKEGDKFESFTVLSCEQLEDEDLPDKSVLLDDEEAEQYYLQVKNKIEILKEHQLEIKISDIETLNSVASTTSTKTSLEYSDGLTYYEGNNCRNGRAITVHLDATQKESTVLSQISKDLNAQPNYSSVPSSYKSKNLIAA